MKPSKNHDRHRRAGSLGRMPTPIITTATTTGPPCLHRARCSRSRGRPRREDREIDGTLCRRLSPEYFAWLRSRMLAAQAAHRPESSPRMPGTRCGSDSTPCRRWPSGVRQGTPPEICFPRTITTHALRPEPGEKPVEVPRKDWIYPGNQAWKCKR